MNEKQKKILKDLQEGRIPKHLEEIVKDFDEFVKENPIEKVLEEQKQFERDSETLEQQIAGLAHQRGSEMISAEEFVMKIDQLIADWQRKQPTETLIIEELTALKTFSLIELKRIALELLED